MPTPDSNPAPADLIAASDARAAERKRLTSDVNAAIKAGNAQDALRRVTEAAARCEIAGDREGLAHTLYLAGVCYRRLNDLPASLEHHQASGDRYRVLGDTRELANVLRAKAGTLRLLGRDDEALIDLSAALEIYQQTGERLEEMRTRMNLSFIYKQAGDLGTAQTLLYECLAYFEQIEQTEETISDRAKVLLNIAANYSTLEDGAQAVYFAQQGIPLFDQIGDRHSLSMALTVLGAAYLAQNDYESALPPVRSGLKIAEEVGVHWVTAMALDDLSTILIHLKRYDEAREALERSLLLNDGSGNRLMHCGHLAQMGFLYAQPDYAGYDSENAFDYLHQARQIAGEMDSARMLAEICETLTKLHEREGNFAQALESFRAYHDADKRLFNENSDKRIQRLELEKAQKDTELAHLRSVELAHALEEAERLRALAEEHARIDALTGISNRRYLEENLRAEVERARRYDRPLSVALVDIDHFKRINDTFGHGVGDVVLGHMAELLRVSCRVGSGDQVARYGGEEFAILLPETGLAEALPLCERLRARVEAHDWSGIASGLDRVTISIGLATTHGKLREAADALAMPEVDASVLGMYEVLARSDRNLYTAKREGRNRVVAV